MWAVVHVKGINIGIITLGTDTKFNQSQSPMWVVSRARATGNSRECQSCGGVLGCGWGIVFELWWRGVVLWGVGVVGLCGVGGGGGVGGAGGGGGGRGVGGGGGGGVPNAASSATSPANRSRAHPTEQVRQRPTPPT